MNFNTKQGKKKEAFDKREGCWTLNQLQRFAEFFNCGDFLKFKYLKTLEVKEKDKDDLLR